MRRPPERLEELEAQDYHPDRIFAKERRACVWSHMVSWKKAISGLIVERRESRALSLASPPKLWILRERNSIKYPELGETLL